MTDSVQDIEMVPMPKELLKWVLEANADLPLPHCCYLVTHGDRKVCIISTYLQSPNLLVVPIWLNMEDIPRLVMDEFYGPIIGRLVRIICRYHYGQELKEDLPVVDQKKPEKLSEELRLFLATGIIPSGSEDCHKRARDKDKDNNQDTAPRA